MPAYMSKKPHEKYCACHTDKNLSTINHRISAMQLLRVQTKNLAPRAKLLQPTTKAIVSFPLL